MPRAATTSDAFNAVAEPRRRDILSYLAPQERPVGDIVATLGLEQPSVSKHLRVLRKVGLVRVRRDGRQMLYQTNAEAIKPLHEWTSKFQHFWDYQLLRIKERAERKAATHFGISIQGEIMTETVQTIENLALNITQEVRVRASLVDTFDALLEQMGPHNSTPEGKPLPMKIEPWPGGRWYRDLGDNNGHFWGQVQAIKRPTLMEITGPLFASYPLLSNVQYRLSESNGETMITFRHTAFGFIPEEQKKNVAEGWTYILERARKRAEAASSGAAAGGRSH